MSGTLPLFHSLLRCDTESSFAGIGNNTARVTWDVYASSCEELGETGASCYRGRLLQWDFMQNYHIDGETADSSSLLIHQSIH